MQSVPVNSGSSSNTERQADGGASGEALEQAIVVDTEKVRGHLDEMVRSTVEQTLNQLLDEEADRVAGAGKYERSAGRKDTRAGSYQRKLQTKAGEVELTVPRLRKLPLETAMDACARSSARSMNTRSVMPGAYLEPLRCVLPPQPRASCRMPPGQTGRRVLLVSRSLHFRTLAPAPARRNGARRRVCSRPPGPVRPRARQSG